jgi:hypothetical protein
MATEMRKLIVACVAGVALAMVPAPARAQGQPGAAKPAAAKESPPEKAAAPADKLVLEQQQVADRYQRLEELLLRMAELSAASDPRRAALLRKAVGQSKERLIAVQFEALVELLQKEQLSRAVENQESVGKDLQALLDLLMTENRSKRIESEKARIREYLKRLSTIINQQKGIQGRSAESGDPKGLADQQGKLAGKTGDLAQDIKTSEEGPAQPGKPGEKGDGDQRDKADGDQRDKGDGGRQDKGDGKGGKPEPSKSGGSAQQKPPADGQQPTPSHGQSKDPSKSPAQGQGQQGQGQPSKGQQGKGQQGKGQQGKGQGDGQPQDQEQGPSQDQAPPQDQQQSPARKRLEAAQQRMREAEGKLKEAQRTGAVEKQEEALRELEQAKAELEQILRQLREEEIERVLAMLEARFTKMLQMQRAVLEGTVRLDKVPQPERSRSHEIEAGRLSSKEAEIDLEADKAMSLLREDGTAVAFPEALGQLRQDIQQVVQRLAEAKVDKITQGIEEEIISSLEEMIQALQKAQKDLEKKRRQQRQQAPPGSGEPQDPPLVDVLAELKMIRALQVRVNSRTERYSKLVEGEQARNADLIEALRRLAERQERVYKITRDLSLGKNQ